MLWLCFIGLFMIGIGVGIILHEYTTKIELSGCLRIDSSDPDEPPYIFLELAEVPDRLRRKKYVTLEVNPNSYISQK